MSSVYYNPEKFGLTILKAYDSADSYEFDTIVVFRSEGGRFLIGHDCGCSCPSPFEDMGIPDLTEVKTLADVADFAREKWVYGDYGEDHVTALLDGLVLQ